MTGHANIEPEMVTPCVNLTDPDGSIPACTEHESEYDIDCDNCRRLFAAQVRATRQTAIDVFFVSKMV